MRRIFWMVVGGIAFWLPAMVIAAVFDQKLNWFILNAIPLTSVALFGLATWGYSKKSPNWGWMLAGIYVFGPISMLAPSIFFHSSNVVIVPGEKVLLILFCLFPPMTLWMAVLNGMIFSVTIITMTLLLLSVHSRVRVAHPTQF